MSRFVYLTLLSLVFVFIGCSGTSTSSSEAILRECPWMNPKIPCGRLPSGNYYRL